MKIERLNINKIKVVFSSEDVAEWNIDLETLTYNTPNVQEMIWTIMKKAEDETGFHADGSQLMVEAIPQMPSGLIMLVTKVQNNEDVHTASKVKIRREPLRIRRTPRYSTSNAKPCIYKFDNLDDIIKMAKRISTIFNGYSNLYKYNNYFYLEILSEENSFENDCIFAEYGKRVKTPYLEKGLISEYGETYIDAKAIDILAEVF